MSGQPSYFKYFNQVESCYLDWNWLKKIDLSWIDEINQQRSLEKQERIKEDISNGNNPDSFFSSDEVVASKDFNDVDFPGSHEWPDFFCQKFKETVEENRSKLNKIIQTADEVFKFEDLVIYTDCEDGNYYFSTPLYGNGSIELAGIDKDSNFDSVDTAVYAFINDYKDWYSEYGKAHNSKLVISNLMALQQSANIQETDCEHEDLGSLGFKHGDMVECPFCKKMAEVW